MEITVDYKVFEKGKRAPQYTIESDLDGRVTLADFLIFAKKTLLSISLNALQEEQAKGFSRNPVITVDGRNSKNIADVQPLGKIFFSAQVVLDKVLLEIYDGLLARSVKSSGTYISQHFVQVGGRNVANSRASLEAWVKSGPKIKEGTIIRFVNLTPYAGRLERNGNHATSGEFATKTKVNKKGTIVRRPNGAYFLTTRAIARKYKFNVPIRFEFIPGSYLDFKGAAQGGPKGPFRRTFKEGGRYKGSYVYPAIRLMIKGNGLVKV